MAIVHGTRLNFDKFWKEMLKIANISAKDGEENSFPRSQIRQALTKHLLNVLVVDPVKPDNAHLYNAAYEHKKEVWAHKAIKDFIISKDNNENFTKRDI